VIPNWADSGSITVNDPDAPALRTRYGIPHDAFVAVYGGNVAFAAGVETIVEAFQSLNAVHDAHLLIAGEGANLDRCRQLAQDPANPRIRFHTPWPRSENSMILSAADVLILPTRGAVSLAAMPSKLIAYMLAARPVIALALPQSDLARVIQGAGCGWVIEPDQPQLLAETIRMVKTLPEEERIRRGQAGRSYALNHLTREACLPKVIGLLEQSAHDSPLVAPDQSDQSGSQAKFTSERSDD
jgi:colanic acid biosynthesis glycosyl transferase WcaI